MFFIQLLRPWGSNEQQCMFVGFEKEMVPMEEESLLIDFENVFGEPKGHNHPIILEEGVIQYFELNKKTMKNQYQIPLVEDLLNELHVDQWFTKLDFKADYHQSR